MGRKVEVRKRRLLRDRHEGAISDIVSRSESGMLHKDWPVKVDPDPDAHIRMFMKLFVTYPGLVSGGEIAGNSVEYAALVTGLPLLIDRQITGSGNEWKSVITYVDSGPGLGSTEEEVVENFILYNRDKRRGTHIVVGIKAAATITRFKFSSGKENGMLEIQTSVGDDVICKTLDKQEGEWIWADKDLWLPDHTQGVAIRETTYHKSEHRAQRYQTILDWFWRFQFYAYYDLLLVDGKQLRSPYGVAVERKEGFKIPWEKYIGGVKVSVYPHKLPASLPQRDPKMKGVAWVPVTYGKQFAPSLMMKIFDASEFIYRVSFDGDSPWWIETDTQKLQVEATQFDENIAKRDRARANMRRLSDWVSTIAKEIDKDRIRRESAIDRNKLLDSEGRKWASIDTGPQSTDEEEPGEDERCSLCGLLTKECSCIPGYDISLGLPFVYEDKQAVDIVFSNLPIGETYRWLLSDDHATLQRVTCDKSRDSRIQRWYEEGRATDSRLAEAVQEITGYGVVFGWDYRDRAHTAFVSKNRKEEWDDDKEKRRIGDLRMVDKRRSRYSEKFGKVRPGKEDKP